MGSVATINSRSDELPFNLIHNTAVYMLSNNLEWTPERHKVFPKCFRLQTHYLILCFFRLKKEKIVVMPRFIIYEIIKRSVFVSSKAPSSPELDSFKY